MAFQNINGVGSRNIKNKVRDIAEECAMMGIDVLGMSEMNIKNTADTRKQLHDGVRSKFRFFLLLLC